MITNTAKKALSLFVAIAVFTLISATTANAQAPAEDPYLGIIPAPASVIKAKGTFTFSAQTTIKADWPADKAVVFLKNF